MDPYGALVTFNHGTSSKRLPAITRNQIPRIITYKGQNKIRMVEIMIRCFLQFEFMTAIYIKYTTSMPSLIRHLPDSTIISSSVTNVSVSQELRSVS